MTSSEVSIKELAQRSKQQRQNGETLRLIDVPATFNGADHIFDRGSSSPPRKNFAIWKRQVFRNILAACDANHGRAFDYYLKRLISQHSTVSAYVKKRVDYFSRKVTGELDSDISRDVADKFGMLYAAGRLGIRFGLLPWRQSDLLSAIKKCYLGARDELPDDGVAIRTGLQRLRKVLRSLKNRKRSAALGWDNVVGYREKSGNISRHTIKCDAFNSIFTTRQQKLLVLETLIREGSIAVSTKNGPKSNLGPKPKTQTIWPDGGRRRSYVISLS
jgi:hypothetical protein